MRFGVTPVPIPNTMVKTEAADGTALETVWESRWLPDLQKNKETGLGNDRTENMIFCAVAVQTAEEGYRKYPACTLKTAYRTIDFNQVKLIEKTSLTRT